MKSPLSLSPSLYKTGRYLVLDFETTNQDFGTALNQANTIVLAAYYDSHTQALAQTFADEYHLGELLSALSDVDFVVCHNAKFELQWLKRCGVNLHEITVYDTMLAEKVWLGNRLDSISLDSCCARHGIPGKQSLGAALVHSGVSCTEIPVSILEDYNRQDIDSTHALFKRQMAVFDEALFPIIWTRCLLTPALADIEFNGLCIDRKKVEKEYERLTSALDICDSRLCQSWPAVNLNSTVQIARLLYDDLGFEERRGYGGNPRRTPTGKRKADSDTIRTLVPRTAAQKEFKDLYTERSRVGSRLSKTIRALHTAPTDVIYSEIHQHRTRTHRLSSTGRASGNGRIQFQNIPREYKPLFKARHEGWLIGECDGAQLEFRAAVAMSFMSGSPDRQGFDDIANEVDVHALSSSILGVSRQNAKSHSFKPLYGGTSGTKKEREYYAAFRARYVGIHAMQRAWLREAVETKQLRTVWGLIYYFPDARVTQTGYIAGTPEVFNYPIQAFATAEIIPIALRYFWDAIYSRNLKIEIVNTVHDSIIVELAPDEVEQFKQLATECMTSRVYEYLARVYGIKMVVPLGVSLKTGSHWGTGNEENVPLVYNIE